MYAESRRPGTSRSEFTARWRQHGALALSYDSFRVPLQRYVHHDPLEKPTDFPGVSAEYDALGEIAAADAASLAGLLESPEMTGPIREDGRSTFARVRTVNATIEERYLREGLSAFSVSVFLAGRLDAGSLTDRVSDVHRSLLERLEPLDRLARRVGVSPAIDATTPWGTYVDLGFDDRASAACAYAAYVHEFARASCSWVTRSLVIASSRCVLYEAGSDPG